MKLSAASQILLIVVLMSMFPLAEARQGSGAVGGCGNAPIPAMPRLSNTIPVPENRIPEVPAANRSVYFAGSVIQEDGTPPPSGTVIELECGSAKTREATADSAGHFGFTVGSNNRIGRVMPDASDNFAQDAYDGTVPNRGLLMPDPSSSRGGLFSTGLIGCELRAESPGYQSSSVRLNSEPVLGYNELAPILMFKLSRAQGTSVSYASLSAPKQVKKLVARSENALEKRRYDEAEALGKSAIEIYPKSAEAWYVLGQVYYAQQSREEARESFMKAIAADPLFVRPYIRLAWIESENRKWQTAAELTNKALELDPIAFPEAYYLNALASYNLHDIQLAEKSARNGERLDYNNQYPRMHLILANIFAMKQDSQGYTDELRKYLMAAPEAEDATAIRAQLRGTDKPGKGN
jgi:tetratricopeptide (TPR) repeat protein